jgi:shikimate kinase / 3-dehydroquinate synthase
MGAGKSTIGADVARLTERPFVDLDEEIERRHGPISEIFGEQGEAEFRRIEEELLAEVLSQEVPGVIALGGGAVLPERSRQRLAQRAFTVLVEVDVERAWERVHGSRRPLAVSEREFRQLFVDRARIYREAADAVAMDVDEVSLACLRVDVGRAAPSGDVLVADEQVLDLYPTWRGHFASVHVVPPGEAAKELRVVERLWDELELDRSGVLVALGGGATTDVGGFVAATYLRGVSWVAVATTLVGQVDAAIGGKTGVNLAKGKNLAGAFHLPTLVAIDTAFLQTLPEAQRREGMAEVVKTGLLAGKELWALDDEPMVRGCAAFKAAVVISDPQEQDRRAILNLGHTFAHALETGAGHGAVSHGEAVALGLTAALRLSERHYGLDPELRSEVERVLEPRPIEADRELAWAALKRDKKTREGTARLVLLKAYGDPVWGVELPEDEVRAALDALIAK